MSYSILIFKDLSTIICCSSTMAELTGNLKEAFKRKIVPPFGSRKIDYTKLTIHKMKKKEI